jgi:Protein of unknown function (DUF3016)
MRRILGSLILLAGVGAAQAAGTVQVSFVQPEKFADVRDSALRSEDHLANLKRHLEEIGARYTADGQTLKVEVLDVDLAGEPKPGARPHDLRVMRGRADWPRMELRYTLEAPGAAPRTGQAKVADMAYLQRTPTRYMREPLPYERRMLEDWFRAEFGAGR